MARRDAQGYRIDGHGKRVSPEKPRWLRAQEDRAREDAKRSAPPKSQSKVIRRNNSVTKSNPLDHDPSENAFEAKARRQNSRQIAEAVALKLYEMGQLTQREAQQIGQVLLRDGLADMTDHEYDALRSDPQRWNAYEDAMRRMPDGVDSRTHEAQQDLSARKLMGKVLSRAWADGKISDDDYRTELNKYLHIHGDGATQELLVGAAVDILEPDPNHPVIWEAPPPPSPIGYATEADMKGRYTAQNDRTNSPSARERRREAAQAAKDGESFAKARAEKELTEAKHSNRALDEVEQAATTAQLDITQAKYDAAYGNDEGGAA